MKIEVIYRRRRKNPRYTQDGDGEHVTVIECLSTDGKVIPPMYIYKSLVHLISWQVDVEEKELVTFA